MHLPRLHLAHTDCRRVLAQGATVRNPASIRRPIEPRDLRPRAFIQHARLARFQINQQQFVAMVRERHSIRFRVHAHLDDPADVQSTQACRLRKTIGTVNLQGLLALGVADEHDPLAVIQPAWQATPRGVRVAVLENRPLPVSHRETLAARAERQQVALRMRFEAVQILRRVHELSLPLGARAVVLHLDSGRRIRRGIKDKQVCAGVVNNAASVRRGMARVEVFVMRVPLQALARGRAGPEIADRFMVGKKINARADPQRAGEIAFQLNQPAELSAYRWDRSTDRPPCRRGNASSARDRARCDR